MLRKLMCYSLMSLTFRELFRDGVEFTGTLRARIRFPRADVRFQGSCSNIHIYGKIDSSFFLYDLLIDDNDNLLALLFYIND